MKKRLREALQLYADRDNWFGEETYSSISEQRARDVLAKLGLGEE